MEPVRKSNRMGFTCLLTFLMLASSILCIDNFDPYFAKKMVATYGTNGTLSVEQLEKLLHKLQTKGKEGHGHGTSHSEEKIQPSVTEEHEPEATCKNITQSSPEKCLTSKCFGAEDIFSYHEVPPRGANASALHEMSSMILYKLQQDNCTQEIVPIAGPSAASVWGFGFLCVTLINLCSLMGLVFMPLMRKSFYQRILLYMVALAVGTLAGSSILFLIPETFGLTEEEKPLSQSYIWKSTTILGGIYLFFLVERILKLITEWRVRVQERKLFNRIGNRQRSESAMESLQDLPMASVKTRDIHLEDSMNMSFKPPPRHQSVSKSNSHQGLTTTPISESENNSTHDSLIKKGPEIAVNGGLHHSHGEPAIKAVAWMVIFGDGLHNFIDGLSIGAAFTQSTLSGISISLAVICEELPHELGDFAILLNSGMSMKQALSYNFMSACMCYLGLIFGIVLGENTEGSHWVFATAAGMFLYISLVDMLPEVNHAAEEEERETGKIWPVFFLQNFGILTGYGIMVLLAVFGGRIDLTHLEGA